MGTNPWSVAVDQSLGKAFVSNYGTSTVTVIDNASASTTVQTGRGPYALAVNEAISPRKTYVGKWFSQTVSVIDEPAVQGAALGMRVTRAEAAGGRREGSSGMRPRSGSASTTTTRTPS